MILIPVMGRTRSSIVAGIFEASGCWVGDTTVSTLRRYDTFENWDVIMYLQNRFGNRGEMSQLTAHKEAPAFRKFVQSIIPDDRLVMLKFIWYYHLLFHYAFPNASFYYVQRIVWPSEMDGGTQRKKEGMFLHYRREMLDGTWIDTERLIENPPDFRQIQAIIGKHSALKWNPQGVDALQTAVGSKRFKDMKRMRR